MGCEAVRLESHAFMARGQAWIDAIVNAGSPCRAREHSGIAIRPRALYSPPIGGSNPLQIALGGGADGVRPADRPAQRANHRVARGAASAAGAVAGEYRPAGGRGR